MASLKLGKDQSADYIMSKDKMKDGSKAVLSKSIKKQLPLPPSQHHQYQAVMTSSPSLPSLLTVATSLTSMSSSTPPIATVSSASSISAIPAFPMVPSSSSSSSGLYASTLSPMAVLREILNNIAMQRNQVLGLINSIDPSFLASVNPKSIQEHKLLNQVADLQSKILDMNDEIYHMRAKNSQLEQQLSLFQGKRGA